MVKKFCSPYSSPPCPRCGSVSFLIGAGKGPHSASLRCAECKRFTKWVSATDVKCHLDGLFATSKGGAL